MMNKVWKFSSPKTVETHFCREFVTCQASQTVF